MTDVERNEVDIQVMGLAVGESPFASDFGIRIAPVHQAQTGLLQESSGRMRLEAVLQRDVAATVQERPRLQAQSCERNRAEATVLST